MIAKVKNSCGYHHEALVNLWTNINYFLVEIPVRMNEFTMAMHCQSPKMKKLAKYFILNLLNMIYSYVRLGEFEAIKECTMMIEWFSEVFFDEHEKFFKKCVIILKNINREFLEKYDETCELIK